MRAVYDVLWESPVALEYLFDHSTFLPGAGWVMFAELDSKAKSRIRDFRHHRCESKPVHGLRSGELPSAAT